MNLSDDLDNKPNDEVLEDVDSNSIIFTLCPLGALALRTGLLNLKNPAQRGRHIQLMEQKYPRQ